MILIDALAGDTDADGELEAVVQIAEDSRFFEAGRGVPSHVGIEYVAQTVAALVGLRARRGGDAVRLGYLLGARRYDAQVSYFTLGARLSVRVTPEFESSDLAKFAGEIRDETGALLIRTAVTVYAGAEAGE
jgi:predicted hotdog family 3-hydroxylacyl-ACP dehydratase